METALRRAPLLEIHSVQLRSSLAQDPIAARICAKRLFAVSASTGVLQSAFKSTRSSHSGASSLMNELGWQGDALPYFMRSRQ